MAPSFTFVNSTTIHLFLLSINTTASGSPVNPHICCVDLQGPGMHAATLALDAPADVALQLVYQGGRDGVSDVWVAGRHLFNAREFTRLDWPALRARTPVGRSISLTGDLP